MKILFMLLFAAGFFLFLLLIISVSIIGALKSFFEIFFKPANRSGNRIKKSYGNKRNESVIIEAEVIKDDSVMSDFIKRLKVYSEKCDEDISSSLKSLVKIMGDMEVYLTNHQNKTDDMKILCEYYIPELLSHLETYGELSESGFNKENVAAVKAELLETIRMVTGAFETILSEFYDDMVLNVSASLDALKASIKMKGLSKEKVSEI
ncbi:MAG: hypothetical protein K2N67_08410 [Mucispirillum sp.]|nr:hypothetical protein [Mucispirillum sp.]